VIPQQSEYNNCKDPSEWDLELKSIVMSINSNINKTTKRSPFLLMHGFEPRTTLNNKWKLSLASGTTPISKERDKARARAHREQRKSRLSRSSNRKRIKLHTGDLVLSKVFAIN
jgi:PREDICTED: similar to orf